MAWWLIKGVGPHFAKRLAAAYGRVFDIIETPPRRLHIVNKIKMQLSPSDFVPTPVAPLNIIYNNLI